MVRLSDNINVFITKHILCVRESDGFGEEAFEKRQGDFARIWINNER